MRITGMFLAAVGAAALLSAESRRPTTARSRRRCSRCRPTRPSAARRLATSRSATRRTAGSTPPATTRSSSRTSSRAIPTRPASTRRATSRFGYWDPIIGCGPPDRHRQVFRRQRGHARQSQYQGPEHDDHGAGVDRSRHGQAVRHDVPGRVVFRFGARAQGAARLARRQETAGGRRRFRRLDPGDGVGGPISGLRHARRARHRSGIRHPPVRHRDCSTSGSLPIKLDPKWNNGDYYGRDEPVDGVAQALKIVTIIDARARLGREDVRLQVGGSGEEPGGGDGQSVRHRGHARQGRRRAREERSTRNSMIYMSKANQLYNLATTWRGSRRRSCSCRRRATSFSRRSCRSAPPSATGRRAAWRRSAIIDGDGGHLDGVFNVAKQGEAIRAFLAQ